MKKHWLLILGLGIILSCQSDQSDDSINNPDDLDYSYISCIDIDPSEDQLEVLTWNIEHFPLEQETPSAVQGTIIGSGYDIWAVQEIENPNYLRVIENYSDEYTVLMDEDFAYGVNEDYHLGYVYNNTQLQFIEAQVLTTGNFESYYFPRKPFLVKFKNIINDEELIFINNHLKCCGGDTNRMRRRVASEILYNYIQTNLSDQNVIVLGDLNTVIAPYQDSDFEIFLDDPNHYAFADQAIAEDPNADWSYPSWPSQIDHILMSDEYFDSFEYAQVLALDNCNSRYLNNISDHRPVLALFKN